MVALDHCDAGYADASDKSVDRWLARLVLGSLREGGLPIGLLAGGNMAALAKIAERHPRLKLNIDHLGRGGGGRAGTNDAAFADLPDMLALAKFPNVGVKMSGAPSCSSSPTRTRTSTAICARSSRRSGPSARSGAPTLPACRARIGNA
jgi:predicted TIM-barrel fold metal-dependent hydrolase